MNLEHLPTDIHHLDELHQLTDMKEVLVKEEDDHILHMENTENQHLLLTSTGDLARWIN